MSVKTYFFYNGRSLIEKKSHKNGASAQTCFSDHCLCRHETFPNLVSFDATTTTTKSVAVTSKVTFSPSLSTPNPPNPFRTQS